MPFYFFPILFIDILMICYISCNLIGIDKLLSMFIGNFKAKLILHHENNFNVVQTIQAQIINQQLEIEESAHLACQQELEQVQWAMDNFITANREKVTKNLENLKESGIILDLVHKDKSVAYSINC